MLLILLLVMLLILLLWKVSILIGSLIFKGILRCYTNFLKAYVFFFLFFLGWQCCWCLASNDNRLNFFSELVKYKTELNHRCRKKNSCQKKKKTKFGFSAPSVSVQFLLPLAPKWYVRSKERKKLRETKENKLKNK